jgi:polysaccharide pyruvyl transferase WcaK-like protein
MITTDMAILFEIDESKLNGLLPEPSVGVCPALYAMSFSQEERDRYVLAHSRVLDYLVERHGYNVVFLPHEISKANEQDDLQLCKNIVRKMKHNGKSRLIETESVEMFKYYLGHVDILISSRMHPAVLACASYVPTLMLAYDHKQTGFLAGLGLIEYALNIRDVNYENLLNKLNLLLSNKKRIRERLQLKIPDLQEDLRMNIRRSLLYYLGKTRVR